MANMILLGAYAGYTGELNLETCIAALSTFIKKKNLVDVNKTAVTEGYEFGRKARLG
jgi:Pyruvate/2-oxoacid:ferredoxin oxidoreductase gamma subunit